jgi:hypothetical protein
MRKVLTAMALASAFIAPVSARAALNFDFSFTNTFGSVPGTVTGEVFGLTDDATSTPTDVVIDSYPAGLTGLPAAPWDIYTVPGFEYGNSGLASNFTVAGGVITAADFGFFTSANAPILDLGYGGVDALLGPSLNVEAGASVAIFTPDTSDVPEPASIVLLLSGLFGLRAIRRR